MRGRKWRAMHARRMFPDALNPTRQEPTTVKTFNEKEEHEKDLEHESRQDYESDQLAGNPPEQGE